MNGMLIGRQIAFLLRARYRGGRRGIAAGVD
jgi:hypothetical protein